MNMKRKNRIRLLLSGCFLLLFVAFTLAVMHIDVRPVGPRESLVGFASINQRAHELLGVNMGLYELTDWLGLVAFFIPLGFAVGGLVQWIRRKSIGRVDRSILVLGGFYLLVAGCYIFFEYFRVNARPVLINGILETSYPSSTTMLVLCVMPTAMMQFHRLLKNKPTRVCINLLCGAFAGLMVLGRLLSGVHWVTDIVGSVLLSSALVLLYAALKD